MKEIKIIGSALPNIPWEDRPEGSSVPLGAILRTLLSSVISYPTPIVSSIVQ